MNIWEQQARNRRNTVLLVVLFVAVLAAVGYAADWYLGTGDFPLLTSLALVLATGQALVGYFAGDKIALALSKARPVTGQSLKERQLLNVTEEMVIAAGIPMPKLYVIPDPDLNAFATGRSPRNASVAVTQGLLDTLSRDELQAVVAHEIGHIRNYDIRLMTLVAILLGTILIVADMLRRALFWGAGRRDRRGEANLVLLLVWLAVAVLAPLAAYLIAMAVSRQREYYADATSAELTRNPEALIRALQRIAAAIHPTTAIPQSLAHMCIEDPRGRPINERSGFWSELFATHPPLHKRIEALRRMAYLHTP
ncbi:MAG: M48 family metallopeptidase [Candidatus Kapabacteria bacterium]|nr:M48 family metallopeptidase [Candidatus Kapabacteria bacterium]MCS7169393.1 M48 family metallopeptidase [Candidatus Kapabacteria bacterium]MDW7997220.1 M48 family metallopeptidase [Bacteroidota bacterium]MDW8225720.1 M48 family metallopeptidase [Bacteroidota bacterium]